MSIIGSNMIAGASGQGAGVPPSPSYQVDRSLRFNTADQSYLVRLPTTAGNRRTFTWSGWVKRTELGSSQTIFGTRGSGAQEANSFDMKFDTSNRLWVGYGNGARKITTNHFRDSSAWLHIVVAYDTTQAVGDDRIKIYINGVRETNLDTDSDPALNQETGVNNTQNQYIGAYYVPNARQHPNIYLANVHLVDGQQLEPTDFGEFNTNNLWVPKAYSGTYGTNGFYLDFSDNTSTTTLGEDSSGNGNDFTVSGFSVASDASNDSMIDTPTNYTASGNNAGNYATLNPLTGVNLDISDGNLEQAAATSWSRVFPTIMPNTGKWYVECFLTDYLYGVRTFNVGVAPIENISSNTTGKPGSETDEIAYEAQFQRIIVANTNSQTGLSTYTANSIVGVAIDFDARTVQFYLNGSAEGTAETFPDTDKDYTFIIGNLATTGSTDVIVNFGQRPFTYTPPTGFKSLCTTNLPDPTFADGSTAMAVKLYTGNGSTQTISGLGFSPDLVWIKNRSQADNNKLLDTVRGATKELESNTTDGDVTNADGLTAFNSDGFDLDNDVAYNTNTESYVAWTWDAGTSTVSNTDGSITSNVRANTTAGFSIVTWSASTQTSATVGHGLGKQPELIIAKSRTVSDNWYVFHPSLDTSGVISQTLYFTNDAKVNITGVWGDWTEMTSSTFGIYDTAGSYTNNGDMVAYCFTSVEGYSKFGTYEGGSTEPPFVYLGFKPKFILVKRTTSINNWFIYDTSRCEFNEAEDRLRPSLSNAEGTETFADFLSNGFKIRVSTGTFNSNNTFIYAAFAEHPFKTARAR